MSKGGSTRGKGTRNDVVPLHEGRRKTKVTADATPSAVTSATVIPFDPLQHEVLGAAIAQVLEGTPLRNLDEPLPHSGPGIYAIYYTGDFAAYKRLADHNKTSGCTWPIYVGQALPSGARKGIKDDAGGSKKKAPLKDRLKLHLTSIREVEAGGGALRVDDFSYRALVLNDTFIRLGEMSLLGMYAPVWNKMLDGFGNNPAGKERATSKKSQWDTVHPGRKRAAKHVPRPGFDPEVTQAQMKSYLDGFNLREGFLRADGQTGGPAARIDFDEAEAIEAEERDEDGDAGDPERS